MDAPESGTDYEIGVHQHNDHGYGVPCATVRLNLFDELVYESRD